MVTMPSVRLFQLLHLRQLRRHPVRAVLALTALGAGVALTVASALLVSSLQESIREILRATAGPAELRVIGPLGRGGLDAAVTQQIEAIDGVEAAVPVVHAVTMAERRDGRELSLIALGVDCRVQALVGRFVCDDELLRTLEGPVLVPSSLARELGPGAMVRTNTGRVPIGSAVVSDRLDEINHGRVVVFALPAAQRLFSREGRIDTVYVHPGPGVDVEDLRERIEAGVGDWYTVLGRDELSPVDLSSGPLLSILGLAIFLAMGLSGLLVYNIASLSLAARRRDLAIAGGIGVGPRALTSGLLAEAAFLGLVGGGIGALAGIGFGRFMVTQAGAAIVEQASGMIIGLHLSAPVLLMGVLVGIVTSLVAAYIPARRARRIDISAEIHGRAARADESFEIALRRPILWLAGAGASLLVSFAAQRNGAIERWQPPIGTLALVACAVCLLAGVGALAPLLLRAALRPLRARGGALRVAVSNLVANPRRTSVMAVAAGAAVGLAGVLAATAPAIEGAVSATYGEAADGRVWVSTLPINNVGGLEGRPSPAVLEALRSIDGVAGVDEAPCVTLGGVGGLLGACAFDGARTIAFDAVAGEVSLDALERGDAMIGTGAARSGGLRPGSILRLPTPTGFAEVRVAGIWNHSNQNGYAMYVSAERFAEIFGHQAPTGVFVRPERGIQAADLARRIERADLDPDLYALAPEQFASRLADEIGQQVTPFWTLQRVLLFVALIAALSTLLLVGVQRRREHGVLAAVGFAPAGLARMTLGEAAVAASAGAALGALASLGIMEAFRNVARAAVGVRPPFSVEISPTLVAVALSILVVAVGGLLPAWRTARLPIVEAIRDE